MRLLDLFCGRWGWSKAFAACGWECVGVDLVEPPEVPKGCKFIKTDVLEIGPHEWLKSFDFICASSPCEQFSLFGQRHFHPNPPYPEMGIRLFNHARSLCEASGVPYVMENVRGAQEFVGRAAHRCGSFHLWGTGVPPLMPQGIKKGGFTGHNYMTGAGKFGSKSKERREYTALMATIPPELSACVADYAERILVVA